MKKTLQIGLALGIVALTTTVALATIEGSKHDLSSAGVSKDLGDDPQDRICVYCHHPHNTVKQGTNGLTYSPLWNRGYTTGTFVPYNNGAAMDNSGNGTVSRSRHVMNGNVEVNGVSLLCMSCHDGQTSMNAYSAYNSQGATGSDTYGRNSQALPTMPNKVITGVAALGSDLSNHHPIGMSWDTVTANDPEIAGKTDTFRNSNITIGSVLTGGDTMECSSCHDVHNSGNTMTQDAGDGEGLIPERFLWTSDYQSQFCLSCHIK